MESLILAILKTLQGDYSKSNINLVGGIDDVAFRLFVNQRSFLSYSEWMYFLT